MNIAPVGNLNAKILIITDFPSQVDKMRGALFSDNRGDELRKMLAEAGIAWNECYITSLLKDIPFGGDVGNIYDFKKKKPKGDTIPRSIEALNKEISQCDPNIIILLGGLPLYAAIQDSSISTWRGSLLQYRGCKAIPTYTPAQIQANWEWRGIAVNDLKRVRKLSYDKNVPSAPYSFTIRPSADTVLATLGNLLFKAESQPLHLAVDIETRGGHTACIGIAWSKYDAICIPWMCVERHEGYFDLQEELAIVLQLRSLLTHPNVRCSGQNFLYDAQYIAKFNGFVPNLRDDTMFMQHILFPGLPKGLDFLASMYCEHYTYWKSEGKTWNPKQPEEQLWSYNCKDACYTWEIVGALDGAIDAAGLREQYDFQMGLFYPVLKMMLRGVRIDTQVRKQLSFELLEEIEKRNREVAIMAGHPLNIRSPLQMKRFFYEDLGLPTQRSRKGERGITTDDEALEKLGKIEPLVRPLTNRVRELRSLGVFHSTFVMAELSEGNRLRCSFNPAGTETYRFNSSKDAFGSGTNLQNIPAGDEDEDHEEGGLVLPNIRKLFIPDYEKLIFDVDLSGADAQVVAWEADDDMMKEIFRSGQKIHAINAKDMFGALAGPDGKKMPYYYYAKQGCHLTNYGGKVRTMAIATGMLMIEAEAFQKRWFEIHPGIKEWHERTQGQLESRRYVENKFGYRRFYFDRIDNILPQALAWIPQSTVACVTNRQLKAVETNVPEAELLLQVHDSLVGQVRKDLWWRVKPELHKNLRVVVPYADPLVIPSGLKTSSKSWGHCEDEKWG